MVLETDYTINWITPYTAILSWDGGSTDVLWTIYVDGIAQGSIEDSGAIEYTVRINNIENHSIAIIKHTSILDDIITPESQRLLRPTIRWTSVANAIEYEIRQIDNVYGEEYVIHTQREEDLNYYSWQFPINLPVEGLSNIKIKVYARGSWGFSEVPYIIVGFIAGHPPRVSAMEVSTSTAGDLELILSQA